MKQKILAMLLCIAMILTMLPATNVKADDALGTNLARSAVAAAGYNNTGPGAINDGTLANSNPATSWNCWNAPESNYPMSVTLTWSAPQQIASMRVMWWSDGGGVTWPSNAAVEYLDGEDWVKIADAGTEHGEYNGVGGIWNTVNFEHTIATTALRMRIGRNVTGSTGVGISEWEVYGEKIPEKLTQAKITGAGKVGLHEAETYIGSTVPTSLSSEAEYQWSISPAEIAVIDGPSNSSEVSVKGVAEGTAVLKLTASVGTETQETEFEIRVRQDEIKSIDIYKTTTAAGVAPILPDSVVANGIEFDAPTPSLKSWTKPDFDFAEEFNSKLIPVTWDEVKPELYAAGQEGRTFLVNGTATYMGQSLKAVARITVRKAAAAAESNSSVTFENVQLKDDFWAPKQETNAKTSLEVAIAQIEQASGGEPNFDNAIKKLNGETGYDEFSGYVFQDSDIYKSIEAISYTLSATQNDTDSEMVQTRAFLEDKLNSWIEKIEKVQYADGYIDTFFTLRSKSSSGGGSQGTHRWLNFANHEMYNAGHFLEAVVAYTRYREGIGEPDYRLYVAGKRFADEIVSLFGPYGTRHEVPGHEEIELALVKFGKLAEEYEGEGAGQDYYDTAKILIDRRGEDSSLRESGYWAGEYSQDETAFKDETSAVGHAVRANYFYTGITDIATMLPDGNADKEDYLESLDTIWESVTSKKTYITGAIGASTASSSSEGFGADYDLPPNQSYAEICAAIAAANWNQRMNLLHEDAKYADMVEKNLYNSILVGTNLDGNLFYYDTRLEAANGNPRHDWFSCACCPPNLMRTIAALSGYMYTVHNDSIFVNMYVGSEGSVNVGGTQVGLKQETNYPWDGNIKMTVSLPESQPQKDFAIKIRIPGWVEEQKNQDVVIQVGDQVISAEKENGYVTIDGTWDNGDVITIDIPMEIRKTESDPNIESTRGKIALQRGPIVYCMEKAGNAQLNPEISNFNPLNFVIPKDAELSAVYREDLLNGVVEITGDVKYASGTSLLDAKLQAIPYYAWNNRGDDADYTPGLEDPKNNSSKMLIWTNATGEASEEPSPDNPSVNIPKLPELRSYATPSVNHVGWDMGADLFADGEMGTFWNGHNDANLQTQNQWMMYDFGSQKVEISGMDISWYRASDNGVMAPNDIIVEYENEEGNWETVTRIGTWECTDNETNSYEFEPVTTSKIRVSMDHAVYGGERVAVAVFEWTLQGDLAADAAAKTALQNLITTVETAIADLDETEYVVSSWQTLQTALLDAKTALDKEDAKMIHDIATAQIALAQAYASLDKKADAAKVAELQDLVDEYESKEADYSIESWLEFKETLDAAKDVIAKELGQSAVDTAKRALLAAAKNLDVKAAAASVDALKAAVAAYTETEYTAASWAKFATAWQNATTVANKDNPGQNDVDTAKTALDKAAAKLDKKATADEINDLKTAVASYVEADYTADSWKRFAYTLTEANNIANSSDAGKKAVEAAKISLETASLKLERTANQESLEALHTSITTYSAYKKENYTEESWKEFSQILELVKAAASGDTAQTTIDALKEMLDDAADNLKEKQQSTNTNKTPASQESITKLTSAVKAAGDTYKEADYTAESWKAFAAALEAAKKVMADANATQTQVDQAQKDLETAIANLSKKQTDTTNPPTVKKANLTLGAKETANIYKKGYTYTTSNKKYVTVTKKGVVKGVKKGKANVTVKNAAGQVVQIYTVTVKNAPKKISKVSPTKKTLKKGKSVTLKVTLPKGTASKLTFTSSNKKVATVSATGVVKAKKKGTATITVKTFNKKTKKVKITVK